MRGVARQPEEEPAPERADLDAKAARVLDGQLELVARATAMLDRCPDPALLRQLVTEVVAWGLHCEEMRAELARYTAANAGNGHILAALLERERSLQPAAAQPAEAGPRHSRARPSRWRDIPGQRALFSVKVVAFIALLGACRRSLVRAHRIAAALAAVTLPVAVGAGAYIALPHASAPAGGGSPAAASVPGWHTSATPIPSTSLIARTVTRPKPKHGSKKQLMSASGLPLPCCVAGPEPSASASASSSPSPVVSVQAGPAQLSLGGVTSLDLSNPLVPQVTFTLSASGAAGSWVSWKVSTTGTDLDFSQDHGVLQAGQSVPLTVSVDPAQAIDGNTEQSFTIGGQTVAVSLPALVSPVLPSPVASILPSVVPSGP